MKYRIVKLGHTASFKEFPKQGHEINVTGEILIVYQHGIGIIGVFHLREFYLDTADE